MKLRRWPSGLSAPPRTAQTQRVARETRGRQQRQPAGTCSLRCGSVLTTDSDRRYSVLTYYYLLTCLSSLEGPCFMPGGSALSWRACLQITHDPEAPAIPQPSLWRGSASPCASLSRHFLSRRPQKYSCSAAIAASKWLASAHQTHPHQRPHPVTPRRLKRSCHPCLARRASRRSV